MSLTDSKPAAVHSRFRKLGDFSEFGYKLMPFRFISFDADRVIMSNLSGQYQLIHRKDLKPLIDGTVGQDTKLFEELLAKHFVVSSNIATNLSILTDEMLLVFKDHNVDISTSLDGPEDLHNGNRPRPGNDSYMCAVSGIERCRAQLGLNSVSALMTTTLRSLTRPEEIIEEYIKLKFNSIFLRWLSPFGFAVKSEKHIGYTVSNWETFYEKGLRYCINKCRSGIQIREEYAAIILRKLLTPFPSGYVDLQSPAGLGISAIVYNYDGYIYASDEGRMLV